MMITSLLASLQPILINLLIVYVGKILQEPVLLKKFFGLSTKEDSDTEFGKIEQWIQKAGTIIIIIGVVGILVTLISAFQMFSMF